MINLKKIMGLILPLSLSLALGLVFILILGIYCYIRARSNTVASRPATAQSLESSIDYGFEANEAYTRPRPRRLSRASQIAPYHLSHAWIIRDENGHHINTIQDCSICSQPLQDYYTLSRLLPCNHCFHKRCLHQWLTAVTEYLDGYMCPLCRSDNYAIENYQIIDLWKDPQKWLSENRLV